VIHLWPNGAPGFESRKDIPEQAQDYWVRNVNDEIYGQIHPALVGANPHPYDQQNLRSQKKKRPLRSRERPLLSLRTK